MRILTFLMLMILVSCGSKRNTQPEREDKEEVVEDTVLGYLSHVADMPRVSSAVLSLRCERPAKAELEFTAVQMKQGKLSLPRGGVGCRIAIKSLELGDERFVQASDVDYSWEKDSVVELVGQLNGEHSIRVLIEQQLPSPLTADRDSNRFLFKVISIDDGDVFTRTIEGTPLVSDLRGLALMTSFPFSVSSLPTFNFMRGSVTNSVRLPTRDLHFAFGCASDPGYARVFEDKLVCGGQIYKDLHFAFVRGIINPSSAIAKDVCNVVRMTPLTLSDNTMIALPSTGMPDYVSSVSTIILRGKYLDQKTGVFMPSCHVYPIAPHLTPWLTTSQTPANSTIVRIPAHTL